jgi:hypothetical protein
MSTSHMLALFLALPAGGAVTQAVDPATASKVVDRNSPDFVRCVREPVTGSIVRKVKLCRTNAEWKRIIEQQSNDATDLVDRNRNVPSGQ